MAFPAGIVRALAITGLDRDVRNGDTGRGMASSTEIVQSAHEALNRGDIDALISLCDPGFRLDMSDRVLNPATYQGHEGIRRFYSEVSEVWESFTWEPLEIKELERGTVALVHSRGKGRGSGLELDRQAAMVWRIEGDQALSLTFYRDPARALAAARAGKAGLTQSDRAS
jgi:ketosteroid isomerase-like protein